MLNRLFGVKNRFQKDIESKESAIKKHCEAMKDFSNKLARVIDADPSDVEKHDLEWDVGNFLVSARSFCHSDGWVNLFYAVPCSMGTVQVGYSNVEVGDVGPGWVYIPKGTATVIYPEDQGYQKMVLEQVQRFSRANT